MQGYRLSKEAQDDLKEIKNYTRMTWGDKQTQVYLSEIKDSLEKLVIYPELGKTRDEVFEGLRGMSVGRHFIFYRLGKTDIEVASILHGRMDVVRYFDEIG
jgi:toxin ParE1/3/4